jgi:hypothetical protein
LLALAKERRHGNVQILPEKVEQGSFDRSDGVDRGAKIESLQTAAF